MSRGAANPVDVDRVPGQEVFGPFELVSRLLDCLQDLTVGHELRGMRPFRVGVLLDDHHRGVRFQVALEILQELYRPIEMM